MHRLMICMAAGVLAMAGMTAGVTVVSFELGIGGGAATGNYWDKWKGLELPGYYAAYVHGSENPSVQCRLVNWDVKVTCSGTTADGHAALGLANIVFNLALRDGEGNLVSQARFLSIINDGSVRVDVPGGLRNPYEPAAFCEGWGVDLNYDGSLDRQCPVDGPGRLYDLAVSGGAFMNRVQFPSTHQHGGGRMSNGETTYFGDCNANLTRDAFEIAAEPWLDADGNGVIDDCGNGLISLPTVLPGMLLGMGIGYTQFVAADPAYPSAGGNAAGVGLATIQAPWNPSAVIGLGCRPVAEGQIDVISLPPGTYTLELTVPKDVEGNPVGQNVIPGTFDPAYPTGESGTFAVKADQVIEDSVTFALVICDDFPVTITGWGSAKQHATAQSGSVTCEIPLDPTDGQFVTECRKGGLQQLVVRFDGDLRANNYQAGHVVVTPPLSAVTETLSDDGRTLTIDLTGSIDRQCYTIDLGGILSNYAPGADTTCSVANQYGDVNGDKHIDLADMLNVKSRIFLPFGCSLARFDVNGDGSIDLGDLLIVKSRITAQTVTCP